MDVLLIEIRKAIGAVQVYISVQAKAIVKIHKNDVEIICKSGAVWNYAFKDFSVQPNSCKGLKYVPNEGLHFRLALGEGETLTKWHPEIANDEDISHQLLTNKVSFHCAKCGYCITKAVIFGRVLPLPSENWEEICGNVFCHGDSTSSSTVALSPRVGDCLTCKTDYVLHTSVLDIGNIETKASTQLDDVHCSRCHSFLGSYEMHKTNPSSVVMLSRHRVLVKNSSGCIPGMTPQLNSRRWIENWIACRLVLMSKEKLCHRFIIQEHGNHCKNYACVWLLCPSTHILCNTYSMQSMDTGVWQKFVGQTMDEPKEQLQMYQTVKVLYECASDQDGKRILKSWASDNNVHPLYLHQQDCLSVLLILMESNASLPPSLQCSNGFKNGYLRYTTES